MTRNMFDDGVWISLDEGTLSDVAYLLRVATDSVTI